MCEFHQSPKSTHEFILKGPLESRAENRSWGWYMTFKGPSYAWSLLASFSLCSPAAISSQLSSHTPSHFVFYPTTGMETQSQVTRSQTSKTMSQI